MLEPRRRAADSRPPLEPRDRLGRAPAASAQRGTAGSGRPEPFGEPRLLARELTRCADVAEHDERFDGFGTPAGEDGVPEAELVARAAAASEVGVASAGRC